MSLEVGMVGFDLDETITARWRRRLVGVRPEERRHWRTRTAYYAAVSGLLAQGASGFAWSDVIGAVHPRGCRSTFYEVTGAHAKHSLFGELLAQGDLDAVQLAWCYRRANAVDQLIDEVKVWTYWPYRERWEAAPGPAGPDSADSLVSAVGSWARDHLEVAAALDCAPPVCAVEDQLVLYPGQYSAVSVVWRLTDVIRQATRNVAYC